MNTFQDTLKKYGIPFDSSMVSYGDYWSDPAIAAVERLMNEGRIPQAFVCANDHIIPSLDYASYPTLPLEYKAEPQHYRAEYVMSEPTDPNSRITFDCGASRVGGTYTITIENMVLTKVE